jgi:hypothetical protein
MPPERSQVPGSKSISFLFDLLTSRFGEEAFNWIGQPGERVDAIGWRLRKRPRYLFSVSTHAGALPERTYDLQVSIVDDSMENGEIVLNEDLSAEDVCGLVTRFKSGEAP